MEVLVVSCTKWYIMECKNELLYYFFVNKILTKNVYQYFLFYSHMEQNVVRIFFYLRYISRNVNSSYSKLGNL